MTPTNEPSTEVKCGKMTTFTRSRLTAALPSMAPFGTDRVNNDLVATEGSFVMDADERFWAKVDKDGPIPDYAPQLGNCWLWTSTTSTKGYGRFYLNGRTVTAHRYAYGDIPDGLVLDHLCRVRPCVRRSHLEPVTETVNILRGFGSPALNAQKTHCKYGHEFTPENTVPNNHGRSRWCRECGRRRFRERYWKKKAAK